MVSESLKVPFDNTDFAQMIAPIFARFHASAFALPVKCFRFGVKS
jgi:hypothetical protein